MTEHFSFAAQAAEFDPYIHGSIQGYRDLRRMTVSLSRSFVRGGTTVVDLGCTTGSLLREIMDANRSEAEEALYLGVDRESKFQEHWRRLAVNGLQFRVDDLRLLSFPNASLAISLFTLQFIPEGDRQALLSRIHDGLVEGAALIIAEKTLAQTSKFQDLLSLSYYDFKRETFDATQILNKERDLRRQMHLWREEEIVRCVVFARVSAPRTSTAFGRINLFVGMVALKGRVRAVAIRYRARSRPGAARACPRRGWRR
jgi:tRNA (cmo5U34)-methyltransferase